MPAVVSLQPSLSWGQKKHENSKEFDDFENNDHNLDNFDFSTSTHLSAAVSTQLPTVAAAPTSPVHRLSATHAQTSHWLLLFLLSGVLLLAVLVSSLRAVVRAEQGRRLTLRGIKHDRSFSFSFSRFASSSSAPLFQQKTLSQLQDKNVKSFSVTNSEKYKIDDSPTDNNNNNVNTQHHLQPQPPSETETATSASESQTETTTSDDRTSRAFTPTSPFTHTFTPPFTAFRQSSLPSPSLPFPFTRPPVHAPFAFSIPFHSNPAAPPPSSTPSGVSRNYLRKVHSSVAPLEDEQHGQHKSQRHRRIRVYHLQTPSFSSPPEEREMDESRRSSTTTTTMTEDSNASSPASRPPPLPLSTSRFAFERPSFEGEGEESSVEESGSAPTGDSDDTIPFIHQPNPDYAGDESAAAPEAPSVSVADAAAPSVFSEEELPVGVWGRHTQVYGGGVCLACLAAENDGQGGEYGANVPMEERR